MKKVIEIIEQYAGDIEVTNYEEDGKDVMIHFLFEELDGMEEGYAFLRKKSNKYHVVAMEF